MGGGGGEGGGDANPPHVPLENDGLSGAVEVVCCSVLRCVLCVADALYSRYVAQEDDDLLGLLQCVAVCCGVLRCVAVCCRVSQCIV